MATFYNQATLAYNGNTVTSNITTGQILETLTATKSALGGEYAPGTPITYVVSLVNSGTTAFNDLTVTDNLGAYQFNTNTVRPLTYVANSAQDYVNGAKQADPTASAAGGDLVFSNINVPAGGNATLLYQATPNAFAPSDTDDTIVNTVTANGAGLTEAVTATETVTAVSEPVLTINKSLSPTTVAENGQVTYTFTILNSGNTEADAGTAAVITAPFTPPLTNLTVTFTGAPWSANTEYTYSDATGAFATTAGQLIVPAATYRQNPTTGAWTTEPGVATLVVTGTI